MARACNGVEVRVNPIPTTTAIWAVGVWALGGGVVSLCSHPASQSQPPQPSGRRGCVPGRPRPMVRP
eukprot:scaffold10062_cov99-Isochrysis_galbana.AAC.1